MLLNKNSFKINGINFAQYVTSIEFGYYKYWGKDSGRNLKGEMTGTLLGIFPKFKLNFRKLTQNELETIAPILDSAFQTTTYYDPNLKRNLSIQTYTGDWVTLNRSTFENHAKANEQFDISVISTKARPKK